MISQPSSGAPSPDSIHFEKYEGLGNDFLIVDGRASEPSLLPLALRVALCDRHKGIGADGIITVLPARELGAKVRMHITNSDGSVPEMCGNGLRCLIRWLFDRGEVLAGTSYQVDTDAGLHLCEVDMQEVRVRMPAAKFQDDVLGRAAGAPSLQVNEERFPGVAVSMGNPHWVMSQMQMPSMAEIKRVGEMLSAHPDFPQGVNVGFAHPENKNRLRLVVWERGAGLTQACGTGACAAVAAGVQLEELARDEDVEVLLPGGMLRIRIPAADDCVWMSGPARLVFAGHCAALGWVD